MDLLGRRKQEQGSGSGQKADWLSHLQGMVEVYQAGDLKNADQATPDWLVLDPVSGRAATAAMLSLSLVM